jgi:ribonuclease G
MKRLIISRDSLETRVALLEEGRVVEFYLERPGRRSLVGNIYKGRVDNYLPGMEAAFVDIGLGRNGFLCSDEVLEPGVQRRRSRRGSTLLRSGKEIVVQVTRDPMGGKGPRLTTDVGLAGRYLVYLPLSSATGVSRRLPQAERDRLRSLCRELKPEKGGLIIRTAAEGADRRSLERDLRFLRRLWAQVMRRAEAAHAPSLLHQEMELPLRTVRDALGPDFTSVEIDDPGTHRRLRNYLRVVAPELVGKLQQAPQGGSLFEALRLDQELSRALERRVTLPSGGHIVIDHTEAMTVIDVNTGRYVGGRFLEDTILRTNLEACREIVRQLRLRDIGGIVVIDFIDMASRTNREAVLALLEAELARDRTKTYVVELSPLGLVEMTRQNVTLGLRDLLTEPCPCCGGEGRVVSEESALIEVERRLRALAGASVLPVVRVEVHPRIADLLTGSAGGRLSALEVQTGRRISLEKAAGSVSLQHLRLIPD